MNAYAIPNLIETSVSQITREEKSFNGAPIWGAYTCEFKFQAPSREWVIALFIRISNLGTPAITSLEIRNLPRLLTKPGTSPYIIDYLEAQNKKGVRTEKVLGSAEEMGSAFYELDLPSIERWQIKFAEQHRHALLYNSIEEGIKSFRLENPTQESLPDAESIHKKIRQKITPEFLKQIAFYYIHSVENGDEPIKALQILYRTPERTVQNWATQARKLGFLEKTSRGKVSRVEAKQSTKKKGKSEKRNTKAR